MAFNNKILLGVVGVVLLGGSAQSQDVGCLSSTHTFAVNYQGKIQAIVAGTDTGSARLRTAFKLVAAPDSAVYVVTDSAQCATAAHALQNQKVDGAPLRPVWVIRAGPDRLLVSDGYASSNGHYYWVIFDAAYNELAFLLDP